MTSSTLPDDQNVWEHIIGTPVPNHIDAGDDSLDAVVLRGSFNVPLTEQEQKSFLIEAKRVLRPKGRLLMRMLTGDKPHETPKLPGKGAPVQFVPAKDDVMSIVSHSGLSGIRLLKYDDPPCFEIDGVKMRETHIEAFKP